MKKLILCVLSAMTLGFAGCSSDELTYDEMVDKITTYNLPQKLVEKEQLPAWITERINKIQPETYTQLSVNKFVWKNKMYYYFQSGYNSFLEVIYDEEGNEIRLLTGDERRDVLMSSRDWVCIYLYSTISE